MSDHHIRVSDELADLQGKSRRLNQFITSNPIFDTLDTVEQTLLRKQHVAMTLYADCLLDRLKFWQAKTQA